MIFMDDRARSWDIYKAQGARLENDEQKNCDQGPEEVKFAVRWLLYLSCVFV
jgi:hypothetical protein